MLALAGLVFWGCQAPTDVATEATRILLPGEGQRTPIRSGEILVRDFDLATGELLHLVVQQHGVDVRLELYDPDGELTLEADSPTKTEGPEELVWIAQSDGSHRLEVVVLSPQGEGAVTCYMAGRRPATSADEGFVRADQRLRAGIELSNRGRQREAVPLLLAALEIWIEQQQPKKEAETRYYLCRSYQLTNRFDLALVEGQRALEIYRQLGEDLWIAMTSSHLGAIRQRRGDVGQSIFDFQQALAIYRHQGFAREAGHALAQLAISHHRQGNLRRSLDGFDEAISLLESSSAPDHELAEILINYGGAFLALNQPADAQLQFRRAETLYRRYGEQLPLARVLNRSAIAEHRLGHRARAERDVETSIRILRDQARGSATDRELAVALLLRGRLYKAQGRLDLARASFRASLQRVRRVQDRQFEAAVQLELGHLTLLQGQPEAALLQLDRVLDLFVEIEDRTGEAMARVRGASALSALERPGEAWRRILPALAVTETVRRASERFDVRTEYFAFRQEFFEVAIDTLMQLHARVPEAGYHIRALEVHERRRARELLDTLAESPALSRQQADPELLEREARLEERLREQTRAGGDDPGPELASLLEELHQVRGEIRRAARQDQLLSAAEPARFERIQDAAIDDATLYLVYALGAERSYLWSVTTQAVDVHLLPARDKIEPLARRFAEQLQSRWVRGSGVRDRPALELSELLLAPVADRLGELRLVVVPMGDLQIIPFAALPVPGSQGADAYLVRDHEIVNLPSLSTLLRLRAEEQRRHDAGRVPGRGIAAFGDPVFSAGDERVQTTRSGTAGPTTGDNSSANVESRDVQRLVGLAGSSIYKRLVHSRAEVEAILSLGARSTDLRALDFEASRETFDRGLSDYRILHFATHAFQGPSYPELSGLLLSLVDESGQQRDGFLPVFEISRRRLPADLVVLSACRTGLGGRVAGEGVLGLTRAFFDAGASRVISSLWNVSDRSTARLMIEFYTAYIREGMKPASALRHAQLATLAQPETSKPYHWAGFIFQGEWRRSSRTLQHKEKTMPPEGDPHVPPTTDPIPTPVGEEEAAELSEEEQRQRQKIADDELRRLQEES